MPDLGVDVARQLKENNARLIPAPVPAQTAVPTGSVLTVTGQSPFGYDWRHPPEKQIRTFAGSPDTVLAAPTNTPLINTEDQTFWIKMDGDVDWREVGGGAQYWEFDGTDLHINPATTTGLDTFTLEVPDDLLITTTTNGDTTIDSDGITRIKAEDGISIISDAGGVSVSSNAVDDVAIGAVGFAILLESDEVIFDGQNALPGLAGIGSFGIWYDTSTQQLKVRAHQSGPGSYVTATIATLA